MSVRTDSEWLSLAEAAHLLGVHPGTVRLWSDKGALPVHRTQGGHRRYRRSEVELWMQQSRPESVLEPEGVLQRAMGNVRVQIAEGRLEAESWYQKLDDEARMQYRQTARSLFHGLMTCLAAEGDSAAEAHSLGYEYATRANRSGLSRLDAVHAFLFFREALLASIIQVYQEASIPSGRAWGEMLKRVEAFTDLILLHLLETLESFGQGS
jgi:excisionase family DNA binding protein